MGAHRTAESEPRSANANILTDSYDSYDTVKRRLPKWCKVTIDDKFGRLPKHMRKYKNKDAIVIGYAHTKGQPVQIMLGMKTDDGILTNEDGSIHVLTMDHTCVRCKTEATRRNIRRQSKRCKTNMAELHSLSDYDFV